jgi:drug/metabolite transporter (DMT)-like permease
MGQLPCTMTKQRAIFMLIVAAIVWSTSGLFVKLLADWSGLVIWGARSGVVAVVFGIWLKPTSLRFTRWEWLAALGYMGTQFFFILGNQRAPAANIIFLQYTVLLYIIPFSYFWLNEPIRRADLIAMCIIVTGMIFFFGDDLSLTGVQGNVYGVISAVAMAVMTLGLRRQKAANPANSILLGSLLGVIIGFPAIRQAPFSPVSVSIILYLGVFQIGLGFVLYTQAIKHVEALQATLLVMLEPIFNPLWVFLVLGELPGRWAVVGALLVTIGVLYRAFAAIEKPRKIANNDKSYERTNTTH